MYNILCIRTCSGYPTPDVHLKGLTLNRVMDILLDDFFLAHLIEDHGESLEFTARCLNAVDTFLVTGPTIELDHIRNMYSMVKKAGIYIGGRRVFIAIMQNWVEGKIYNDYSVSILATLSHKTLVAIFCMLVEDKKTLAECLELAALTPTYDTFGRINGLV